MRRSASSRPPAITRTARSSPTRTPRPVRRPTPRRVGVQLLASGPDHDARVGLVPQPGWAVLQHQPAGRSVQRRLSPGPEREDVPSPAVLPSVPAAAEAGEVMPGMNPGVNADHSTMVAAFQAALVRQGLIVLLVFAILGLAWLGRRAWPGASARRPAPARGSTVRSPGAGKPGAGGPGTGGPITGEAVPDGPGAGGPIAGQAVPAEPAGRRVLRIGFGLLWLFDGVLQAQPKMPADLPSQVIQPAACELPALGTAPGELGRDRLVARSRPGRRRGGIGSRPASESGCWSRRAVPGRG